MGKKDFTYELINVVDVLEETGNWAKVLIQVSWNGKPPTYDIRNIDMSTISSDKIVIGKGISISDNGIERLVDALIDSGFYSNKKLREKLEERESIFKQPKKKKRKIKIRRIG